MDSLLPGIRNLGAPNGAVYKSENASAPNTIVSNGLPSVSGSKISPNHSYDNAQLIPELGVRLYNWLSGII